MNKIFLGLVFSILVISIGNYAYAQTVEFNSVHFTDPVVIIETSLGDITIEFFPTDAPKHVENFLKLASSGFYDETLFHRIIPGFMIQGGDPNTISGDQNTWGMGGPVDKDGNRERVDAEFNPIKHNRGIVSMARSADPNSGGSQFFIVHQDSNFLDEQYTVFGRIVTHESFDTLDKIANVPTGDRDIPINHEAVRILSAQIANRADVPEILELPEPERTLSTTPMAGSQQFESPEHNISLTVPDGWLLQTPDKTMPDSPDIVAVGPKVGVMNPVISLTVQETKQRSFDDLIREKDSALKEAIDSGNLKIIGKQKKTINGFEAYELNAQGYFSSNGENVNVKFKEVMFYDSEKFYTLSYANGLDDYNSQLPQFEDTISTFAILSDDIIPVDNLDTEEPDENGGCLIATATFGSELAPQVQQLRELRDNTLLSTASGTAFMTGFNQIYYSFSPSIADYERENPIFKEFVKIAITPMLSTLSIMEYAESESQVLGYGIGVILMNLGMYFAAPAIVVFAIRNQFRK
ncbi:peptidylprolyl isomerase [Nitrosopumilus sp.]|uniref:peptidylprolyl isomerase n=1 Tax=Nitrosopumilus sp. TaxID=2024843 RepID=UPI002620414F|nr:peptidylprolyl isomerase [Nitrosopumilus sp.]